MLSRSSLIFTAAAAVMLFASAPAKADCYDVFGCSDKNFFRLNDLTSGPNCDFLWTMRNSIYKERGYCFTTRRAIANFGNAGCQFDNASELPMNRYEQANVSTIVQAERIMSCPR